MVKLLALERPGAIAAIVAVWIVSRSPLSPARPDLPDAAGALTDPP